MTEPKPKLNVAMIGSGFMGRAHSNAFRQVSHFFDVAYEPNLVWFNYRRVPAIAFAKELLNAGRVGQAFHYRAVYLHQSGNDPARAPGWRFKRAEAGSGASGDLLSHSIDLALHLNGPITD